jgi:hypothetical protein
LYYTREKTEMTTVADVSQLPMRKRKKTDEEASAPSTSLDNGEVKKSKFNEAVETTKEGGGSTEPNKHLKRLPMSKAREIRLEQNRKAARESRRRKKVMIEELQRSVIFFSRANGTLKQQNDELARLLMQAQTQVAAVETQPHLHQGQQAQAQAPVQAPVQGTPESEQQQHQIQQAQAQAVATQAMYESQGFPAAAARAAAHTMNAGGSATSNIMNGQVNVPIANAAQALPTTQNLPAMQPGATMQAMANFQQAAAAAMQAAVQGMQGIPGVATPAATPVGANPQQAYHDTMTALAMQQAAAAAAGQQFFQGNPFMQAANPLMTQQWQQQVAAAAPPLGQQQLQPAPVAQPQAQAPAPPLSSQTDV